MEVFLCRTFIPIINRDTELSPKGFHALILENTDRKQYVSGVHLYLPI